MFFIIVAFVLVLFLISNKLFIRFRLTKKNYKGILVPYSGGTIIFFSLIASFFIFFKTDRISIIKFFYFTAISFVVYLTGMVDDILGDGKIKGVKNNILSLIKWTFSTGIIKAIVIFSTSLFIHYFFNEEYWYLKGIITAFTANLFNLMDLRPGRCIKLYFIISAFLYFGFLRWTGELYFMLFTILIGYYYFEAYGYSMLGDSGSNLIGFLVGLMQSEMLATGLLPLVINMVLLLLIQIILDRWSLTKIIESNYWVDYLDRFFTERQEEKC